MSEKIAVDLGNVQQTMLLPLWGRAVESQKEKPLLVDQTALRIIGAMDYDFSTLTDNLSDLTQMAWIMRSLCIDEALKAFLKKYPGGTIVNIGCGMDTTFDRVDNGTLLWYDLDLPDVIELRRQFIQETERRKFITASFLDESWLNDIRVNQQVFFIAAGVFYYFEESEVKCFLVRLADHFPGSELIFDASSPYGIKTANRMVIKRSGLDEKSFLKWGLKNAETLTTWDPRFQVLNTHYYFGPNGHHLGFRLRLIGWISDRMKIQYMVHLRMIG
ncbi:MAG TPA: class I SAM-dependent methyltransferase [Anaerolineae bacterium]|nr:class I SAM-dependent methyltransferase [Anaerolineae bacterium]